MKTSTKYQKGKVFARQKALDWQQWVTENQVSYEGLAIATARFTRLAKRYGLVREFHENGIL